MRVADFPGRRVGILGTGREGRSAWRYLRGLHPDLPLSLIDEQSPDPGLLVALTEHDRIVTGPLSEAGLDTFDILVRSPGVSLYRKSLQQAIAAGVSVTTPSNLWFEAHRDQRTVYYLSWKTTSLPAPSLKGCARR